MKLKEVSIEQTKQIRQYEPIKLTITAQLTDEDDISQRIDEIRLLLDHKLNEERRQSEYERCVSELENLPDLSDEHKRKNQKFIAQYNEHMAKVEALEWL